MHCYMPLLVSMVLENTLMVAFFLLLVTATVERLIGMGSGASNDQTNAAADHVLQYDTVCW